LVYPCRAAALQLSCSHLSLPWIAFESRLAHGYAGAHSSLLESLDPRLPARPWQGSERHQHRHTLGPPSDDLPRLVADLSRASTSVMLSAVLRNDESLCISRVQDRIYFALFSHAPPG